MAIMAAILRQFVSLAILPANVLSLDGSIVTRNLESAGYYGLRFWFLSGDDDSVESN